MKIISIIPARGGSKGIPKKNIRYLNGQPLISYTINEALKSKILDEVIVSTEDIEIAKISEKYGAKVIERPLDLAKDDSLMIDVIFHVMEQLKKDDNIIVLLQPTSPLRIIDDIDNSIKLFLERKCETVISVCEVSHPPYWSLKIDKGYLKLLFGTDMFKKRRQDFDKIYIPNGAIFIAKLETLLKYKSFYCEFIIPYIMPIERSIDIDDEINFKFAEFLLKD